MKESEDDERRVRSRGRKVFGKEESKGKTMKRAQEEGEGEKAMEIKEMEGSKDEPSKVNLV